MRELFDRNDWGEQFFTLSGKTDGLVVVVGGGHTGVIVVAAVAV